MLLFIKLITVVCITIFIVDFFKCVFNFWIQVMQSENSTTKTFDKIKLLLQNLFDIAYLAFCYTSMFPRSILWSRLCLTKLNVRLHLLIFEHNFLMSIVMSLLRWWCSAKSKVFKILLTIAYKNNLVALCNNNINDAKK